jgi:tetratricopeptide (TPR) repeat protein
MRKYEMLVLSPKGMTTTWVVDSNAFIHLGSLSPMGLIESLENALKDNGIKLHVTSGVHDEVRNVRFQKWDGRPNLLSTISHLLTTVTIGEGEIRAIAQKIGEKAAPQDVDLSLMVLAARYELEGRKVVLVTDDFKMTTTKVKAGFGFETCPPSTFINRLSESASNKHTTTLRTLSRHIRAAEMRYAISRNAEYDIQAKLTWLVDSLLTSRPQTKVQENSIISDDDSMVLTLMSHMRGEKIKKSRLKKLGRLPEICKSVSEIDSQLATLLDEKDMSDISIIYEQFLEILRITLENTGVGLSPLEDSISVIAHRAMAGPISRLETVLGLMANLIGRDQIARLHFTRALHQASLSNDNSAEIRTLHHLGLLALAEENFQRSAELFEAADLQAQVKDAPRLRHVIAAGLSRHLSGDDTNASSLIQSANDIIEGNENLAIEPLLILGRSLMGIDRPWLAMEIFDEALECAIEAELPNEISRIQGLLLLVSTAAAGQDNEENIAIRGLLDRLNTTDVKTDKEVNEVTSTIEKISKEHLKPLEDTWKEWRPASDLFANERKLDVLRSISDSEGQTLVIVHHNILGGLGLWMPANTPEFAPNQHIVISGTRIKVADATAELADKHNIRGVIAIEDPDKLDISVDIIEAIIEEENN